MAIIRNGIIVNAISGALGPVVFVAGKGSPVVRPRPVKTKTSSANTLAARSRMANIRRHWQQLSTDDQNTWRTAAATKSSTNALGVTSPMTGYRFFMRYNLELRLTGTSIQDTPSTQPPSVLVIGLNATFEASADYTIFAFTPLLPSSKFYFYGWPFARDYEARAVPRLRFLRTETGTDVAVNVKPEWVALFGELQEGQRFAFAAASSQTFDQRNNIKTLLSTVLA